MRGILEVYIIGCIFAALVIAAKVTIVWVLRWLTGFHVLIRNLKKLEPTEERGIASRALGLFSIALLGVALSWITVVTEPISLAITSFRLLRELLRSAPEKLKEIRYPLRASRDLPRESVWARVFAESIVTGQVPPTSAVALQLIREVRDGLPDFDAEAALQYLAGLEVLSHESLAEARAGIRPLMFGGDDEKEWSGEVPLVSSRPLPL